MACNSDCPICFETITLKVNRIITECGHEFHCSCLMKSVTTSNFDCPLCRAALAEAPVEEEDDDDNYSEQEYEDSYADEFKPDVRFDTELTENHLLRGFRGLFEQQQVEPEKKNTDDDDEEEEEKEWNDCEIRVKSVAKFTNELVNDCILSKRIPYEKLLNAYLVGRFPDQFDFVEFQRDDDKIFSILEEKVKLLVV